MNDEFNPYQKEPDLPRTKEFGDFFTLLAVLFSVCLFGAGIPAWATYSMPQFRPFEPQLEDPGVPEPSVPEPEDPEPSVPEPEVPEPSVPEPEVPEPSVPDSEKPQLGTPEGTSRDKRG